MTFIESFLPAFAANVAALMVQVAGAKTAEKFKTTESQKSIEQCVHHGTTALLSKAMRSSKDDLHKLTDCFSDFFKKKAVARELSKLLRGKEPDPDELVYIFEDEGGWNLEKMPPIDFDSGIRAFIAAFMASAREDPLLNRIIRAEQLIQQTQLQAELLEEMRRLSAFLSREGHRVVGIEADKIEARNVANTIVVYEVKQVDSESKRAETEEQHYLKTLVAHCDQLDLATIDELCGAGETIRVSDVFTTLNLQGIVRDPDETVGDAILKPRRKEQNIKRGDEKESAPVQALEAIAALPRLVLLGQPGGGKSTVVNYLAAQLAKRRSGASTAPVSIPGWKNDERPLPVRILLRHLARHHSDGADNTGEGLIWSYIRKQLTDIGCEGFYTPLRQILQEEGGIVFFDGLDEVVQTENDPMRTRMKDAVLAFAEPLDRCRIVVTSREYAYLKSDAWRLPPDRFPDVTLDAFNDDQIKEFTNTWYQVIGDTGIGTTSAVGCFPSGASPYGCLDMAGNVWEWTRSLWGKEWGKPDFDYPYEPTSEREDLSANPEILRVLRGGAFHNTADSVRCANRNWSSPLSRDADLGVRCVCAPNTSVL